MIISLLFISSALFWLLKETKWLTIRLPVDAANPEIKSPKMEKIRFKFGTLDILALAGVIGPVVLIIGDLTATFIQPEYRFFRQSMSSLAITSKGWIQTIGFMFMGIMIESFTVAIYLNIKRRRGFGIATALLVFFGFGMLIIGTFRTDALGAPRTLSGYIHLVTAYTVFGLFPIALSLMLNSIKNDIRWRGMFVYTIITICVSIMLALLQPFFTEEFQYYGAYERIMVLNAIAWLITFAIRLLVLSFQSNKKVDNVANGSKNENNFYI
jgi:hypothetical protein